MEFLAGFGALQIAAALAAGFVAAFVRGLAGFGLAILLVPVLALVLEPVEAVLVTNALATMLGLLEAPRLVREAHRSAWPLAGLTLVFTVPGFLALAAAPADLARLLIALVALGAFGAVLVPAAKNARALGPAATGLAGAGSGLATGFAGMPGAAIVPFYMRTGLPKAVVKPSMLLIFHRRGGDRLCDRRGDGRSALVAFAAGGRAAAGGLDRQCGRRLGFRARARRGVAGDRGGGAGRGRTGGAAQALDRQHRPGGDQRQRSDDRGKAAQQGGRMRKQARHARRDDA